MAAPTSPVDADNTIVGRARRASLTVMNVNPQLGIWQAAGTAIAHAPNLTELRDVQSGGENISFNAQGHSTRLAAVHEDTGRLAIVRSNTWTGPRATTAEAKRNASVTEKIDEECCEAARAAAAAASASSPRASTPKDSATAALEIAPSSIGDESELKAGADEKEKKHHHFFHKHNHEEHPKAKWGPTIVHGLRAFWKFFTTPSGFIITIYCLNIVGWGAMLFFLLLKAAPAMNHPSADDDNSPRKIWLEIDSQILNALFCVTGFGLAPWRFRDLYWFVRAAHFSDKVSMQRLAVQNKAWFRPPAWARQDDDGGEAAKATFTGEVAPPTPMWKLGFTVWMMVLNTLLQAVLCYFMWHYNRIDRPGWATGTFIGLGCGVAMLAGIMSWWEGRKVKKIEGPEVKIVDPAEASTNV